MHVALASLLSEIIMVSDSFFYHCLYGFHVILSTSLYPAFVFRPSALFYCFIVLTVCLSQTACQYFVYNFKINNNNNSVGPALMKQLPSAWLPW